MFKDQWDNVVNANIVVGEKYKWDVGIQVIEGPPGEGEVENSAPFWLFFFKGPAPGMDLKTMGKGRIRKDLQGVQVQLLPGGFHQWVRDVEWMNECVFIYRTYHMSHDGLQFYWVRSNISLWRRLWLPLSVHFWSHSPTQPIHEMWDETRDRPPHRELRAPLFSIAKNFMIGWRKVFGCFVEAVALAATQKPWVSPAVRLGTNSDWGGS